MPGIKRPDPDSNGENHAQLIPHSQRRALLSVLAYLVAIHGAKEASVTCLETINRQIDALNAAQAVAENLLRQVAGLNVVNPLLERVGRGLTGPGGQLIQMLLLGCAVNYCWST